MSDETPMRAAPGLYDPDDQPELYDAILSKRIVAFVVDAIIVVLLMVPAALVVFIVGVVTFGIGWVLYGALFAIVALGYVGLTLGGPQSATIGMRWTAIEMRTWNGGRCFPLLAVMHALIFWFSVGLLTPLILLVGLFTRRRQLLHDLLLGTLVLNSGPLRARER
ncbi:MAG: RDD family protein [Bauldia sp.]|uniref:RDD family protein n=1 Tax=Bauldia sp. TaxID=2575872 RepID=UPI001DF990DF|nr:RDD family protein [Bauldia sp.]MCB1497294.1 RDD family protein [Bauldia sp.]